MVKIVEILGATNHGNYCIVEVMLDNQETAEVFVGGRVECWFDPTHDKYKAFVMKKVDK